MEDILLGKICIILRRYLPEFTQKDFVSVYSNAYAAKKKNLASNMQICSEDFMISNQNTLKILWDFFFKINYNLAIS